MLNKDIIDSICKKKEEQECHVIHNEYSVPMNSKWITCLRVIYIDDKTIIPPSVVYLEFYNLVRCECVIPGSVLFLTINYLVSEQKNLIPNSVTHYRYNGITDDNMNVVIPNSVTSLTIDETFENTPLRNDSKNFRDMFAFVKANLIPNSVTHLTFGSEFNSYVGDGFIPPSVIHLEFGEKFNKNIHNTIPNSVRKLIFGNKFKRHLGDSDGNKYIPFGVEIIVFGANYNREIKSFMPASIIKIYVGSTLLKN